MPVVCTYQPGARGRDSPEVLRREDAPDSDVGRAVDSGVEREQDGSGGEKDEQA